MRAVKPSAETVFDLVALLTVPLSRMARGAGGFGPAGTGRRGAGARGRRSRPRACHQVRCARGRRHRAHSREPAGAARVRSVSDGLTFSAADAVRPTPDAGRFRSMSERIQKRSLERAERARAREQSARTRADNNHHRGEHRLAQLHEDAAHAHASAARMAEDTIAADQRVQGDELTE